MAAVATALPFIVTPFILNSLSAVLFVLFGIEIGVELSKIYIVFFGTIILFLGLGAGALAIADRRHRTGSRVVGAGIVVGVSVGGLLGFGSCFAVVG